MQKAPKKESMTLDKLAEIIQRGFERLDRRFRIMRLEYRVQKMESDFRALLSAKR
ncbi:MAG: hypothetical protein Q7R63_02675 [bacterium]|nr:hypothetical protein [bacterium]